MIFRGLNRIDCIEYEDPAAHKNFLQSLPVNMPLRVRVDKWKKPRSTGPRSQSNHLHGHLSQLAIYYSYTMSEMKEIMKDDVPEWPVENRILGHRVVVRPVSEALVSSSVANKAIEWCHMIAAEEKVILKEGDDEA